MILVLLIVPIYFLYRLTEGVESSRANAQCIGILLVFTLLFSACISLFTSEERKKTHERQELTRVQGQKGMRYWLPLLRMFCS